MKLLILLSTICIAAASFTSAQAPMEWQPFAPRGEEFSTELPRSLELRSSDTARAFRVLTERYDSTFVFVFSEPGKRTEELSPNVNFIRSHQAKGVSEMVGGAAAEKYEFDDEGFHHIALLFSTPTRTYLMQTAAPSADDAVVRHFFETLSAGKLNATDPPALEPVHLNKLTAAPSGSGPSPTPKLLEKPRPQYTDAARMYSVSGNISLRVTFRADGSIGDVVPLEYSKLPFGLTNSAITAAKGIKFEPAAGPNGPMDVTKTLSYTFAIY